MIQRIGGKKPKQYFATLDMTSPGYWQAPLVENTRCFTAFFTFFMGIFE